MPLIQSINGATRRIYLDAAYAVAGELTFHPVLHLYPEYKAQRQANEAVRPYDAFMAAYGNVAKGGGKYTPRYLMLLAGTKLVVPNGITKVWITGELLTDDASDPFDDTLLTNKCRFYFQPPTAESVASGGGAATPAQIADAVFGRAIELGVTFEKAVQLSLAALAGDAVENLDGTESIMAVGNPATERMKVTVNPDGSRSIWLAP